MTRISLDLPSHEKVSKIELGQNRHYSSTIEKDQGLLFAAGIVALESP